METTKMKNDEKAIIAGLNRTMQYGNPTSIFAPPCHGGGLNRTMQYGN